MREVDWIDEDGRKWRVQLPEGVPDDEARRGIPVGPASLADLELPLEVEVRLHNQLWARRLFDLRDVTSRREDVVGAIRATFKLDAERIITLYR